MEKLGSLRYWAAVWQGWQWENYAHAKCFWLLSTLWQQSVLLRNITQRIWPWVQLKTLQHHSTCKKLGNCMTLLNQMCYYDHCYLGKYFLESTKNKGYLFLFSCLFLWHQHGRKLGQPCKRRESKQEMKSYKKSVLICVICETNNKYISTGIPLHSNMVFRGIKKNLRKYLTMK